MSIRASHCGLFIFGKEAGADGVGGQPAQFVAGKSLLGVRQEELVGEIGAEEGRVVGVERDQEAEIEIAAQGVRGERGTDAGADVGGGVELESRRSALSAPGAESRPGWPKGVADALGADGKRFPDGLGAGGFAGVVGEAQAGGAGLGRRGARKGSEPLRRSSPPRPMPTMEG